MIVSAPSFAVPAAIEPMPQPSVPAGDDGFGFDDLLDIVNPLQHIPLIGTIYREITGDTIELPARLAGGALFGGVMGFLASLGTVALEGIVGESSDEVMTGLLDTSLSASDPFRAAQAYRAAYSLID